MIKIRRMTGKIENRNIEDLNEMIAEGIKFIILADVKADYRKELLKFIEEREKRVKEFRKKIEMYDKLLNEIL